MDLYFTGGAVVLPDQLIPDGFVQVVGDAIQAVGDLSTLPKNLQGSRIDLQGGYLVPGYVDLHVHGGADADFMDGTEEAFRTVCQAHLRHGTTSLLPTTTVARHDQHLKFLELCRRFCREGTQGANILGAHFYGPYIAPDAPGCHPL